MCGNVLEKAGTACTGGNAYFPMLSASLKPKIPFYHHEKHSHVCNYNTPITKNMRPYDDSHSMCSREAHSNIQAMTKLLMSSIRRKQNTNETNRLEAFK